MIKTDKIEKVRACVVTDLRSTENQDPSSFVAVLFHSDQDKASMRSSTPCVVARFNISVEVNEWEVQTRQDVVLPTDADVVRECLHLEGD